MAFNNNASDDGFIGNYSSVDEVIAADQAELDKIGGSFEDIGDRMSYILGLREEYKEAKAKHRVAVFKKYGHDHTDLHQLQGWVTDKGSECEKVYDELKAFRWRLPDKSNVVITEILGSHWGQDCPFDCGSKLSANKEWTIRNQKTGKELVINEITAHLAKEHHLLEKGNDYGITAKEFYEHFMPE
ncbi:MAG: hypothetical protein KAT77_05990 [Nanoarchaeota archaeon]|nr:hypothetical protein [Nanoarchaeota archaeon]